MSLEPSPAADGATLPQDPALPGIAWLARRVRTPRSLFLVKHRPGRRMVLREGGAGDPRAIYWKLYRGARGAALAARHGELRRLAAAERLRFMVPEVLGYWPEGRLLALAGAPGQPVTRLHGAALLDGSAAAGRALASLHACPWEPGRSWTLADEAEVLARGCAVLAGADAALGARAERLRDRLAREWLGEPGAGGRPWRPLRDGAALPLHPAEAAPPVPLHRDFHPAQVLCDDQGALTVLDWDDAAAGPAVIDVANFTAHLALEARRGPHREREWRQAGRAFLDAYFEARALARWPWLSRFETATLLRLAGVAVERRGDLEEARRLLEACESAA